MSCVIACDIWQQRVEVAVQQARAFGEDARASFCLNWPDCDEPQR